jgi:hypothetical protein
VLLLVHIFKTYALLNSFILSVCLSVCLSACSNVYLCVSLLVCLSVCLNVCLPVGLFVRLCQIFSSFFSIWSLPTIWSRNKTPENKRIIEVSSKHVQLAFLIHGATPTGRFIWGKISFCKTVKIKMSNLRNSGELIKNLKVDLDTRNKF